MDDYVPQMPKKAPRLTTHDPVQPKKPGSTARGYGHRWQQIRAAKLRANPICEWCGEAWADQVHHRNHDQRDNRPENIVGVCGPCHREHHAKRRRGG